MVFMIGKDNPNLKGGVQTKKCTKCGEEKELNEFHKDKTRKDGIRGICKICVNTQIEYSKFRKEQKKKLLKKKNRKERNE